MKVRVDMNYYVSLDWATPVIGESIGKEILKEAGCTEYYDDPQHGRVYVVEKMPQNMLLHGIKWVEV